MKPAVRTLIVTIAIILAGVSVRADSLPVIQGQVSGIELCPQSVCGAAIFVGAFKGRIGFNPHALGTVAVAVHHGPLPVNAGDCTPIPDGVWKLWVGLRRIEGVTAGTLCYNGDNTYHISVGMLITSGGIGTMTFDGTLDHNVFPPTIKGTIAQ